MTTIVAGVLAIVFTSSQESNCLENEQNFINTARSETANRSQWGKTHPA